MIGTLTKRALGILALGASLFAGGASARDLTITAWGGSSQAAQQTGVRWRSWLTNG